MAPLGKSTGNTIRGPMGPRGPRGPAGPPGPAGTGGGGGGGSTWYDGAGAPAGGLGADGDYYLRTSNGNVYTKAGGAWTVVGNIRGPAGADGLNGVNGSTWYSGAGVPAGGTGVNGDYYYRTSNGDIYQKAAGVWAVIGNITGPAGANGADGADAPSAADVAFPAISNLLFRFNAELSPVDLVNGRVSKWYDISGNNNHTNTQATAAKRPLYFRRRFNGGVAPGLYFNGAANGAADLIHLTIPIPATLVAPFTLYFVLQDYFGGTASFHLLRGANVQTVSFRNPTGPAWAMYDGTIAGSTTLYNQSVAAPLLNGETSRAAVRIDVYNGASSIITNNGVEVTINPGSGAGGMTSPLSLGCEIVAGSPQQAARMLLYEVGAFTRAINLTERGQINDYFCNPLVASIPFI